MNQDEELREKLAQVYCLPKHSHKVLDPELLEDIISSIKQWAMREEEANLSGKILYMDLCSRLIKRILEFNPNEHDIELNLCGIIEKARQRIERG